MVPPSICGDSSHGVSLGRSLRVARWKRRLVACLITVGIVFACGTPVMAQSAADFPVEAPANHLVDLAHVFSRSSSQDIERTLEGLSEERVDAKVITVSKLDYGVSLSQLGEKLLAKWSEAKGEREVAGPARLLLLIDAQTRSTAVVASPDLGSRLPADVLRSTAETTMALPLRSADRYRQASLDGISRLAVVLRGGEDPGEPELEEAPTVASNVPSKEETQNSNAFTWVVALLVIGTVVPMATWWIFSR